MEFFDELFEDETFSENISHYINSEEPYTPIMESPLLLDIIETNEYLDLETNEYLDLDFDPATDEVNPNQETLDLYQNPPEVHQHQQIDNSLESPLPMNILEMPNNQFYQDPIHSTMMGISQQQFAPKNIGFTTPNMIELSNLILDQQLPLPLREEGQYNMFGNSATSVFNNFQNQQIQPNLLPASTFLTREPMLTNQYQNFSIGNQNMVASSFSNWSQNLLSNQQLAFASSYEPYGNQWQPLFSRYPTFNTQTQIGSYTNSFTSFQGIQDNVNRQCFIHPLLAGRTINNNNRIVFGHQQQNQFVQGESSFGQRMIAQRNVYPFAPNPPPIRMVNKVYDPRYESAGLYIDPHFRCFSEITKSRRSYLMNP